jgi:hypothetical protein
MVSKTRYPNRDDFAVFGFVRGACRDEYPLVLGHREVHESKRLPLGPPEGSVEGFERTLRDFYDFRLVAFVFFVGPPYDNGIDAVAVERAVSTPGTHETRFPIRRFKAAVAGVGLDVGSGEKFFGHVRKYIEGVGIHERFAYDRGEFFPFSMQRFYFPSIPNESFTSDDSSFVHQVSRVLRMAPDDRAVLFSDEGGGEYEFVSATKREVSFRRVREILPPVDGGPRIVLFQSLPNRFEKIEYLLQKGTEVGISEFVFFSAERSQKLAITPNKIERFEAIVREALEQCGGFRKPSISFSEAPSKPFDFPVALFHTSNATMGISEFAALFAARPDRAKGGTLLSSVPSV